MSEGFKDAIKSYNPHHKDSSLEEAVDALQTNVSSYCNFNELFFKVEVNSGGYFTDLILLLSCKKVKGNNGICCMYLLLGE